jgi:plastocyanin
MNSLDSRVLGHGDCFAKKFSYAGTVRYLVVPAGVELAVEEDTFTILVKKQSDDAIERRQHTVAVSREGAQLIVDQPQLEIEEGDTVLWHGADASVPGFAIRGSGGRRDFDSSCLEEESIYTHAFGVPGEYHWVDAYGSNISGVIIVSAPETTAKKAQREWLKRLSKGTLIHIRGEKVDPGRVQLVTGQTVFWAVEKAPGISITDTRLLSRDADARKPASR